MSSSKSSFAPLSSCCAVISKLPHTLSHDDVGLPASIRVRYYASDAVATFLIKLVRMPFEILDVGDLLPQVIIQIDASQRGHVVLIVGPQTDGQTLTKLY